MSEILNATDLKNEGNNLFKEKKYKEAIEKYMEALTYTSETSSRMFHPNMDALIPNRTLHAQISVLDKLFICKRLVQHLCVSFSCPTNNFFVGTKKNICGFVKARARSRSRIA